MITKKIPKIAIVVPCYNEEEVLEKTIEELLNILDGLIKKNKIMRSSFICFIDDGSKDKTWQIILSKNRNKKNIKGIKLSRNFGHQNALLAGLIGNKDKADCIISLDADLQDDINIIEKFIDQYLKGNEIVYGIRKERKSDSFFKKQTALLFYKLMSIMGVDIHYNHADYRLVSKIVLDNLSSFQEINLFLRGIFPLIGFRSAKVFYNRKKRFAGKTKYSFYKMLSFAIDGITSFSIRPLRLVTILGIIIFLISLVMAIYVVYEKIVGHVVPGWASIVLPIYLIGGIQILCLGIIGEYIGKIYKEVKNRPRYIVEKELK